MSNNMNLFDLPPMPLPNELTTILAQNTNIKIEHIVSYGQDTDWCDQHQTEFVVLLDGNAKIEFASGHVKALTKGDTLIIRPHEKHRVAYTSTEPPCVWLCVFYE